MRRSEPWRAGKWVLLTRKDLRRILISIVLAIAIAATSRSAMETRATEYLIQCIDTDGKDAGSGWQVQVPRATLMACVELLAIKARGGAFGPCIEAEPEWACTTLSGLGCPER